MLEMQTVSPPDMPPPQMKDSTDSEIAEALEDRSAAEQEYAQTLSRTEDDVSELATLVDKLENGDLVVNPEELQASLLTDAELARLKMKPDNEEAYRQIRTLIQSATSEGDKHRVALELHQQAEVLRSQERQEIGEQIKREFADNIEVMIPLLEESGYSERAIVADLSKFYLNTIPGDTSFRTAWREAYNEALRDEEKSSGTKLTHSVTSAIFALGSPVAAIRAKLKDSSPKSPADLQPLIIDKYCEDQESFQEFLAITGELTAKWNRNLNGEKNEEEQYEVQLGPQLDKITKLLEEFIGYSKAMSVNNMREAVVNITEGVGDEVYVSHLTEQILQMYVNKFTKLRAADFKKDFLFNEGSAKIKSERLQRFEAALITGIDSLREQYQASHGGDTLKGY